MKKLCVWMFVCGVIVGWGISTLHWNNNAQEQINVGVKRALEQGVLIDAQGNVYTTKQIK